ncbi:MAG TPA: hypothetical protein VK919_06520 [Solirubrobacterales bacterium]|nr:hypothetical protein [Solirubrobacterales bacterium]
MGAKPRAAVAVLMLGLAAALGGCGDGDANGDGEDPAPPPPPPETLHRVPELPARWRVQVNRPGGFALGVPPGWRARNRGATTLVRSFDRLTAVSIVPDRTDEAIELSPSDFATRAFSALGGYAGDPEPGPERRFEHRYEGVELRARATAEETGVRQRVRLVVLRRGRHATFTVVIAQHLRRGRESGRIAERMLGTLRSRPVRPRRSP